MQMQFADAQHIIVNTATEAAQRSRARATCAGSGSAGEVQQFCAILLKTQPQSRCDMKRKKNQKENKTPHFRQNQSVSLRKAIQPHFHHPFV